MKKYEIVLHIAEKILPELKILIPENANQLAGKIQRLLFKKDNCTNNETCLIEIALQLKNLLSSYPETKQWAKKASQNSTLQQITQYTSPTSIPISHAKNIDRSNFFLNETETYQYHLWYGTNRKPKNEQGFSNQRDQKIHYGTCQVSIPKTHRFGEIGRSWYRRWLNFEFTDDNLHLNKINASTSAEDFYTKLNQTLNQYDETEQQALIFLHGYNCNFEEAAIRAAQIGFDLKMTGVTAFFSWASKGNLFSYPADEAMIEASEGAISQFLLDFVQRSGAKKIHLIAHSMGNRGLLRALQRIQMQVKAKSDAIFGQIILAAPDLDVELFQDLAMVYQQLSERTTIYISPRDKAVGMSKFLHTAPRVGFSPPITIVEGIDTIEVDYSGFNLLDLGHTYFAQAKDLLQDIFDLLRNNISPDQRLHPQKCLSDENKNVYWQIKT